MQSMISSDNDHKILYVLNVCLIASQLKTQVVIG